VQAGIDTLVLGCTHYPLLRDVIARELRALSGRPLPVVDSAEATAIELESTLRERDLCAERENPGQLSLLVTDMPKRFAEVAARFLGRPLAGFELSAIDL
jgi:glutamate racemase